MVISYDYDREPNDAYYEPQWVDDRIFQFLDLPKGTWVWDPACGTGTIPDAAKRMGLRAFGSDIVQRWPDDTRNRAQEDFFDAVPLLLMSMMPSVIVSNPPFKIAQKFAEAALAHVGLVAFILPTQWIQGAKRAFWMERTPLKWFLPLVPRPSMPPIGSDAKPEGGKVDYAWFVWEWGHKGRPSVAWLRK